MAQSWPIANDYTLQAHERDDGQWDVYDEGRHAMTAGTLEGLLSLVVTGYPVAVYRQGDTDMPSSIAVGA